MIIIVRSAERTGSYRPAPKGMLIHVTGSGVLSRSNPLAHALKVYKRGSTFPDALIGYQGDVHTLTAEDTIKPAHAAWRAWERRLYASRRWSLDSKSIEWASDYFDDLKRVRPSFYRPWFDRWQADGRSYRSPIEIVEKCGGPGASPNSTYYGVEILTTIEPGWNMRQIESAAKLFVMKANEHGWLDPKRIVPATLPQPWLCGHDDVNPARRFCRKRGTQVGRRWDPGDFPWRTLGEMIVDAA